jgi:hypothetical protein
MVCNVFIKHAGTKLFTCCLRNVNLFAIYGVNYQLFWLYVHIKCAALEIFCLLAYNLFSFFYLLGEAL